MAFFVVFTWNAAGLMKRVLFCRASLFPVLEMTGWS
jgi:hypothetical protein